MRLLKTAAVLVAAVLAVAGCGDDDEGDTPVDTSTIPATAPGGELLCDFLPAESAALALGGEVSADGQVTRDTQGVLTSAGCRVTVDGGDDVALRVLVDYMMGNARTGFEDGLADAETYHQLSDAQGLGYTFTDGSTAQARLSRGDYLIEVRIAAPAEGRDGEADAAAIAQQVGQTLEIPEEWTLQGTPPVR